MLVVLRQTSTPLTKVRSAFESLLQLEGVEEGEEVVDHHKQVVVVVEEDCCQWEELQVHY